MNAPHKCYLISGLSGSGKSTIGRLLAGPLPGCVFVEGDSFYRDKKPFIVLSDGARAKNWDTEDAIDWARMSTEVTSLLGCVDVILVTFLPRLDLMTFPIARHVRLVYSVNAGSREDDIQRCLAARRATKGWTPEARERDATCVREVVYPTYERTRALFPGDAEVPVYAGDARRPREEILADVRHGLGI